MVWSLLIHSPPLFFFVLGVCFLLGPAAIIFALLFETDTVRSRMTLSERVLISVVPRSGRVQAIHASFWSLLIFTVLLMISNTQPEDASQKIRMDLRRFDQVYPRAMNAEVSKSDFRLASHGPLQRLREWLIAPLGTREVVGVIAGREAAVLTMDAPNVLERFHGKVQLLGCGIDPCGQYMTPDVRNYLINTEQDPTPIMSEWSRVQATGALLFVMMTVMPFFGIFILYNTVREHSLRAQFGKILEKTPWRAFPQTTLQRPGVFVRLIPGQFFTHWTHVSGKNIKFNYRAPGGSEDDYVGVSVPLGTGLFKSSRVFLPLSLVRRIEMEFQGGVVTPISREALPPIRRRRAA